MIHVQTICSELSTLYLIEAKVHLGKQVLFFISRHPNFESTNTHRCESTFCIPKVHGS